MKVVRYVSATERGHIAHTLKAGPSFLPTFNRFVLEGEGDFDIARWQAAALQAAAVTPCLSVRMAGRLGWMRWATGGAGPRVQLIENCRWDGTSEQNMDFLLTPMDLHHGPLVEIFLLPGSPARVAFRTHHGVMDGVGTRIFIDDVFRILNGEQPLGARADLSDADIASQFNVPPPVTPNTQCFAMAGPATEQPPGYLIRRVSLPKRVRNVIPKLLEKLAGFARASNEGDGTVRLRVTVDGRRDLPEDQRLISSNLTGLLYIDVDADMTERDLVRIMRNKIKDHEYLYMPKMRNLLKWLPLRLVNAITFAQNGTLHRRTRYGATGTVSSLGELEEGQYQCPGFVTRRCFALPIPFFMTSVFITIWGNPSGMELIVGMPSSFGSDGRIERLCRHLEETLSA